MAKEGRVGWDVLNHQGPLIGGGREYHHLEVKLLLDDSVPIDGRDAEFSRFYGRG
jgi:hypothetical protein